MGRLYLHVFTIIHRWFWDFSMFDDRRAMVNGGWSCRPAEIRTFKRLGFLWRQSRDPEGYRDPPGLSRNGVYPHYTLQIANFIGTQKRLSHGILRCPPREPTTQVLEEALCRFECQRESDEAHVSRSSVGSTWLDDAGCKSKLWSIEAPKLLGLLAHHFWPIPIWWDVWCVGWWCFWSPSWIILGGLSPFAEHPVDQSTQESMTTWCPLCIDTSAMEFWMVPIPCILWLWQ